ncbi:MAG: GNAT family N-acetyltransferase [Aeoliella sp.]
MSIILQIATPETPEQLAAYYDLRWRFLRAPWDQPRGSERDELEEVAEHVTARDGEGRLLGIGRLHLNDECEAQIRYMAVEEDCRGHGVGRAMVSRLEELAVAHGVLRIVLNARDTVVGFYEKLGYRIMEEGPTMFDEVKHVRMEKRL